MTSRLLIVPAAGLGSRLAADRPKLLVSVAGVPMIDRILRLFSGVVSAAVVVVNPASEQDVRRHLDGSLQTVSTVVQTRPTGMLDAIMLAGDVVRTRLPDEVWIVWCDQVAIQPATVQRLAETTASRPDAALVMPTVTRQHPYIHLRRDARGRIDAVLHRREGDAMPDVGESDMGLFALSREAYLDLLPAYARDVPVGSATGERNFLPFIAWASVRRDVITFPATDEMEAVGVNTPDELRAVERYLTDRERTAS
jgi:bifunctional UDP-N-acetylglucosamine pyrophosphorylase / glucosamine-1-phosphate N-acetyltransferase